MRNYTVLETVIGKLFIVVDNGKLSALYLDERDFRAQENLDYMMKSEEDPILLECERQLKEYFAGDRISFSLPLERKGTSFQMDVWNKLVEIPYGKTKCYQQIAEEVGRPNAVRAVGQANKANKLPIIIPCHRVIGKNRTLTGYAGTRTEIKDQLLSIEGAAFKQEKAKM